MIKAVIMAGGSGTRLWPLSRAAHPKQFLKLHGQETMLQGTFNRLSGLDINSSVTICNEEHRFFVAEQLRQIDKLDSIILEPFGRNTAPAIALAAFSSLSDDPLMLVLSADHVIDDEEAFVKKVMDAVPLAQSGNLVSFGIIPNEPNTGYGYIKKGISKGDGFIVDSFVEKPSIELAKEYFNSSDYLWNSGMFLFKASAYLEELQIHRSDIYEACKLSIMNTSQDGDFIRIDESAFSKCPSDSIDYSVMEKTDKAVVIPMDIGWNDIGSWSALWDISEKDINGNAIHGDVILDETNNSYIRSDNKLIAVLGVDDLVIVDTKDVLVVANKNSVQNIKTIVQQLKHESRPEWEHHREVYRPWGKFDSIDHGEKYQAKRITVKPGAKLSVQLHNHRSEHWVVVTGIAKVTNGKKTFILHENESTYIPVGVIHALENPGKEPLEIIEIQTGTYFGEDDIIRFDDIYGRTGKK